MGGWTHHKFWGHGSMKIFIFLPLCFLQDLLELALKLKIPAFAVASWTREHQLASSDPARRVDVSCNPVRYLWVYLHVCIKDTSGTQRKHVSSPSRASKHGLLSFDYSPSTEQSSPVLQKSSHFESSEM